MCKYTYIYIYYPYLPVQKNCFLFSDFLSCQKLSRISFCLNIFSLLTCYTGFLIHLSPPPFLTTILSKHLLMPLHICSTYVRNELTIDCKKNECILLQRYTKGKQYRKQMWISGTRYICLICFMLYINVKSSLNFSINERLKLFALICATENKEIIPVMYCSSIKLKFYICSSFRNIIKNK